VEINHASYEELQTLPGIQAGLAERGMAHRLCQKFDDLDHLPSIGPATLKRLNPLNRIESAPP